MTEIGRDDAEDEDEEDNGEDEDGDDDNIKEYARENSAALVTESSTAQNRERDVLSHLSEWNWNLQVSERQERASQFLQSMGTFLLKLCKVCDSHISAARQARAEAGAHAFKSGIRMYGTFTIKYFRYLQLWQSLTKFSTKFSPKFQLD